MHYVGADNERHRPIMIHRALFGIDRALLRHPRRALRRRVPGLARAGAGHGAAVADRHDDYAAELVDRAEGRRLPRRGASARTLDTLGARIRNAKTEKVPYVLVVGDDDVEHGTVGVNERGSDDPERDVARRRLRRAPRAPTVDATRERT